MYHFGGACIVTGFVNIGGECKRCIKHLHTACSGTVCSVTTGPQYHCDSLGLTTVSCSGFTASTATALYFQNNTITQIDPTFYTTFTSLTILYSSSNDGYDKNYDLTSPAVILTAICSTPSPPMLSLSTRCSQQCTIRSALVVISNQTLLAICKAT